MGKLPVLLFLLPVFSDPNQEVIFTHLILKTSPRYPMTCLKGLKKVRESTPVQLGKRWGEEGT